MIGSVYGSQALKVRPNPGPDPNPQSSAEPRTGPVRTVVHYFFTTKAIRKLKNENIVF